MAARGAPHRSETFKLSADPFFIEKVRDIVGLYMNPPEHALVLYVDEKSQMQALDRSQSLLPMRPGHVERRSPDYVRHGTTSLFAALDVKTGEVIGECFRHHRAREFRKFLGIVDKQVPDHLDVHIVMDNYATHKTPAIRRWFAKRTRYTVHFTPTSASWLNLVERWFSEFTQKTHPSWCLSPVSGISNRPPAITFGPRISNPNHLSGPRLLMKSWRI